MAYRGKYFFDLVNAGFGGDQKKLQSFVDAGKDIYNKMDISGFPFTPQLQIDPTFEQVSMEYDVHAMATWVDYDSPGTPLTSETAVLQTGNIPRTRKTVSFTEMDFRKMSRNHIDDMSKFAQQTLLNYHERLINSHNNSATYGRHQMVSTGKLELTETNNRGGIKGTVFQANIPEGNKVTLATTARWWTDDDFTTQGSASNPVKDLQALGRKTKGAGFHFEIDTITLDHLLDHTAVVRAIGYNVVPEALDNDMADRIGGNLDREARKARLERLVRFPIKEIDSISRIDRFDKKLDKVVGEEVRSFNPYSVALVPNGTIGETMALAPLRVGDERHFAEYHGGRLLFTYEFLPREKEQIIETEMTMLSLPTRPNDMFILNFK